MKLMQRFACAAACLLATTAAFGQISSINSAVIQSRVFNDIPGALFTGINAYPGSVSLTESGVSAPTGFANRDVWQFSNNGTTAYGIGHNQYFTAAFDLTLTGNPISPRKEAGFLLSSTSVGDIQFIVNTDGHEVVQFGGSSFFSFNSTYGLTYNSGQTIHMSLTYTIDPATGRNALMLGANGFLSPYLDFSPTAGNGSLDIGDGSTLGGYFQIVNDPANPNNAGSAVFGNISIIAVPEPGSLALLGLGLAAFLLRRRA